MNSVTLAAFRDELEKIAFDKRAGLLRDVGMNIGNTLKGFVTPVSSIKKGLEATIYAKNTAGKIVPSRLGPLLGGGFLGAEIPKLVKKEDPSAPGISRTERTGRMIGSQLGMLMGMPHGIITGGVTGGVAGSYLGGKAGKAIKNKMDKKKALKASMMTSTGMETPGYNPNPGPQF